MSRRLVFGNGRLAVLTPIGEINGVQIRQIFGADGSEEDKDGGEGGDVDEEGDDEDDSDSDGDKGDDDDKSDQDKSKRRSTNRRGPDLNELRKKLRAQGKELATLREHARKAELADKSELDRTKAEMEDVTKKLNGLKPKYEESLMQLEIIKESSRLKLNWADVEDVLNDRTLNRAIEIDDDGEITGVEEALKDLAKRKPHFLAKSSESEEDDDGERKNNTRSGGSFNGTKGKNSKRQTDRDALVKKYPALGGTMVDTGGR